MNVSVGDGVCTSTVASAVGVSVQVGIGVSARKSVGVKVGSGVAVSVGSGVGGSGSVSVGVGEGVSVGVAVTVGGSAVGASVCSGGTPPSWANKKLAFITVAKRLNIKKKIRRADFFFVRNNIHIPLT